jgi:predicted flap endonuclease-1-like 5' DNA nuclease
MTEIAWYWHFLGLKPGATRAEIKSAYHRLAKLLHRDHGGTDEDMQRLNEAYHLALADNGPTAQEPPQPKPAPREPVFTPEARRVGLRKLSPRGRFLVGFATVAAVAYCVFIFAEEHEPITLEWALACVASGLFVTWQYGGTVWALKQLFVRPYKGNRPQTREKSNHGGPDAPLDEAQTATLQESLPEQAAPLENETRHPGRRPYGLRAPRGGRPDDLKRIRGIGPQAESLLNGIGIWHYGQIAAWSAENMKWVASYLVASGRIEREKWVDQARGLAASGGAASSRRTQC